MIKWKRETRRDGTLSESRLRLGPHLRELCVHGHIDDRSQLFATCYAAGLERYPLETLNYDIAEKEALRVLSRRLGSMVGECKRAGGGE